MLSPVAILVAQGNRKVVMVFRLLTKVDTLVWMVRISLGVGAIGLVLGIGSNSGD